MTDDERKLAAEIARVVAEKGWSFGRIAKLAKVSKPTVSRIISGKESSWQSILAVAVALGIPAPEPDNYLSSKEEISVVQRWRSLADEDQAWVAGLMRRLARVAEEHPGQSLADILPLQAPLAEPEEERRELPYYGEVAAFEQWSPEYVGQLEPEGFELVPVDLWGPRRAVLQVRGESMSDVGIHGGDMLLVEAVEVGGYQKGNLVIARTPRGMVLKEYGGQGGRARPRLPAGVIRLLSHAPGAEPIEGRLGEEITIVAKVVHRRRGGTYWR